MKNHLSLKDRLGKIKVIAGFENSSSHQKTSLISNREVQALADLTQTVALTAGWIQKKLVCCECFKGECIKCGYNT
jgi:hypothetical protein